MGNKGIPIESCDANGSHKHPMCIFFHFFLSLFSLFLSFPPLSITWQNSEWQKEIHNSYLFIHMIQMPPTSTHTRWCHSNNGLGMGEGLEGSQWDPWMYKISTPSDHFNYLICGPRVLMVLKGINFWILMQSEQLIPIYLPWQFRVPQVLSMSFLFWYFLWHGSWSISSV